MLFVSWNGSQERIIGAIEFWRSNLAWLSFTLDTL
jgi:hypothetical protein